METLPGETPIDPSGLKHKAIKTRSQLNLAEAANIRKVLIRYLVRRPTMKSAPFDFSWALKLHAQMFGDVWTWAGIIRSKELNLGSPAVQIEAHLYDLFNNLRVWETTGVAMLEQAVMLHHRAVQIHPFLNGNGRWSRMLANIWLKQHRHHITVWPEEAVGSVSPIRDAYIAAVRQADDGDFEPLIELHRRYTKSK